jgi:hypothetical protein
MVSTVASPLQPTSRHDVRASHGGGGTARLPGISLLPATLWVCAVVVAAGFVADPASISGWAFAAMCAVVPPVLVLRRRTRTGRARRARLEHLARPEPRIRSLAAADEPPLQQLRDQLASARREGQRDEVERIEVQLSSRQSRNDYR